MSLIGKRENLAEVLTHMSEVRAAAERLGIEPIEAAQRILPDVMAFAAGRFEHQHERAYQVAKRASELARALT